MESAEEQAGSIGEIAETLRRRREALGLTLAQAQEATRIRSRYLEALEEGNLSSLPEVVYVRGFLRSYADYLGLDGAELVARFDAWRRGQGVAGELPTSGAPGGALPAAPRLTSGRRRRSRSPVGRPRRLLSRWFLVAVLSLAALYVLGAWPEGGERAPSSPAPGRDRPAAGRDGGTRGEVSPPAAPTGAPGSSSVSGMAPGGLSRGPVTAEQVSLDVRQAAYGRRWEVVVRGPAGSVELVARATGRCWVRAVVDGRPAWEGIVQAGEERRFLGSRSLELRLGNPAAVSVSVAGRALPALGSAPVDVVVVVPGAAGTPPGASSPPPPSETSPSAAR